MIFIFGIEMGVINLNSEGKEGAGATLMQAAFGMGCFKGGERGGKKVVVYGMCGK